MINIRRGQDAVKANSPRGPRPFNQLLAFQSIERLTNNCAFVTHESRDLVGTGETCYVSIHKGEYIPVTEQRDAHAVNTTLERGLQPLLSLDDNFILTQSCCPSLSHNSR
jgi:hypothetical protein